MTSHRFTKSAARKSAPAAGTPHACTALDVPLPFSPLITELLAMHAHTRHLTWLAQRETCREEFQAAARSLVSELLRAWEHQTGGHGSIEDLLQAPPEAGPAGVHAPGHPEESGRGQARRAS
ncbi:hypothetical protein GCM10017744_102310 [Streptomyces antimycoticus]|uniref:Uncharacterized protein n=1 Tax=Streptomyces antimycoticus TaxID=68175 RepID=A0A4D4KM54_9ACTN|nr:hypothetical protein [Streptomyces antimycoticus]GDY49264.1 hypothetical protein SANT12839_101460 [Streptomyces antimycoticus]